MLGADLFDRCPLRFNDARGNVISLLFKFQDDNIFARVRKMTGFSNPGLYICVILH